jgi:hypothetical protein
MLEAETTLYFLQLQPLAVVVVVLMAQQNLAQLVAQVVVQLILEVLVQGRQIKVTAEEFKAVHILQRAAVQAEARVQSVELVQVQMAAMVAQE